MEGTEGRNVLKWIENEIVGDILKLKMRAAQITMFT